MDPLCSRMVRAALCWLVAGALVGGLMLLDGTLPGALVAWLAPSHAHMLFVGWFLQFVIGVAYWLLPRKRTPAQPLGYDERLGMLATLALNAGLLLRVAADPPGRCGPAPGCRNRHLRDPTLATGWTPRSSHKARSAGRYRQGDSQ